MNRLLVTFTTARFHVDIDAGGPHSDVNGGATAGTRPLDPVLGVKLSGQLAVAEIRPIVPLEAGTALDLLFGGVED